jgi:hypothetical protein
VPHGLKYFAGMPALALAGAVLFPGVALSHDVIFQAHATGIIGTLRAATLTKKLLVGDVGLSCKGVPTEETVSDILNRSPLYLKTKTVSLYTLGVHSAADATATLNDFHLDVPGVKIDSTAIGSYAHAECDPDTLKPTVRGGATILDLMINGTPVTITGEPNQTINVGDVAKIVFNEQTVWKTEFKTNAMHLFLFNDRYPASGDVIFSYSRAKVSCTPTVPPS